MPIPPPRIRTLLTAAALVVTAALAAGDAPSVRADEPDRGIVPVPRRGLDIRPDRGEGARYRIGDSITLELDIPYAGCLTVYDVTPSGRVQVIFPHAWEASPLVRPGRLQLPARHAGWAYEVGGPRGTETVIAVLSAHRYPAPRWLEKERLSAAGPDEEPADALARRAREAEGIAKRIVIVPDQPRPGPIDVATTWIRVR